MTMNDIVAAPDLSQLPYETRVDIALAECLGATWRPAEIQTSGGVDEWWMKGGPLWGILWFRADGRNNARAALRELRNDPAAWGGMLEKECAGWQFDGSGHCVEYWDGTQFRGETRPTLPEAVRAAVLAKYGKVVDS